MRRIVTLLTLLSVYLTASPSLAIALLNIDSDNTFARVYSGFTNTSSYDDTGGTTAIANLPVLFSSITKSNFNASLMSGTFDQIREGDEGDYASGQIDVEFTMNADAQYNIAGSYTNSDGVTTLIAYLYDFNGDYLFNTYRSNVGGPFTATLGGLGGNNFNYLAGNLSGTLLAGHSYEWNVYAETRAYPGDAGGSATGSASLSIGAVPEQSSVLVWSLVALTIGGACWWKRSAVFA